MLRIIIGFFLFTSFFLTAQVGGESIVNFMNLSASAKQAALGGKNITLSNDINQAYWNPASINESMEGKIGIGYLNFLADINHLSLNHVFEPSHKIGMIHAGIHFADYGSFDEATADGELTGQQFRASDLLITFGKSIQIPKTSVSVGANFKFINSILAQFSSMALGVDIGFLFQKDQLPYTLALTVRNMGFQLTTFDQVRESFPFSISIGASYLLKNAPFKFHVTIDELQQWQLAYSNPAKSSTDLEGNVQREDIDFFDNALRHMTVGVEILPQKKINLMLGYNFRRAKELNLQNARTFSGFNFGLGFNAKKFDFNYAFSNYHSASSSHTFTLTLDLFKKWNTKSSSPSMGFRLAEKAPLLSN